MELLKYIVKELKINHWIKNLVVFVPAIFSGNLFSKELFLVSCIVFIAFCFISSSIYIFNDIIDLEQDKKHIEKRKRPLAQGKISIKTAVLLSVLLLITGCFFTLKVNVYCFIPIVSYVLLNILYSLKLKNIVITDAVCIAFGFILRILAGCFAIKVIPSPLVILLTFFLSLFFTFLKRKMEYELQKNNIVIREVIKSYNSNILNQLILINAILSISFYFTYVMDERIILKTGAPFLYLTSIPFALIIFRILYLSNNENSNCDPIIFFEKDLYTKLSFISYFVILWISLSYKI